MTDTGPVTEAGSELLHMIPPMHGACAGMSAMWQALLRDRFEMPATLAVAGDLVIEGRQVFVCDRNVPDGTEQVDSGVWDGHCWVQIGELM